MNTLIALYIWLASTLGLPSGSHDDPVAPGCSQDTQSAETDCDDDSEDSRWYFERTTHIYNGF